MTKNTSGSPALLTAPTDSAQPLLQGLPRKIQKLKAIAYLGFDEWAPQDDHHVNLVHFGSLHHPTLGRQEACFKMFPMVGQGRRGLLNEITGWLLAHYAALPQPGFACLVNVPLARLKPLPAWLKGSKHATWPAFCTERLPYRSAAVQFDGHIDSPTLKTEIKLWTHHQGLIAVDEHLGYADRHFNNLLRAAARSFMVIDFDRLAVDPGQRDWTVTSLSATRSFDNQLARRLWNNQPGRALACEMLEAAQTHRSYFAKMDAELRYWCKNLLTDATEQAQWHHFIAQRADLAVWLLQRRFGLIHEILH